MRDPSARRQAIQALIEGATTAGERAAAEAALDRHDDRHGHVDPAEDLADAVRIVAERPPDIVWPYPGKRMSNRSGGNWGLHKRIGRLCLAWPPWATRGGHHYPDLLMVLSWIVDPEHRYCTGCLASLWPGSERWRPLVYSGRHPVSPTVPRQERWCGSCLHPPGWESEVVDKVVGFLL